MTVENFVRIVWRVFEKIKKVEKGCFLAIFGLILTMFLTSQSYDFDAFAHVGHFWVKMTVQKFSLKGREKKKQKNDKIA